MSKLEYSNDIPDGVEVSVRLRWFWTLMKMNWITVST
jgi:hypothetical protein